jgi:hypothetical protein
VGKKLQLLLILAVLLSFPGAFAVDAGTLPDSPLYFFDGLAESFSLFFTSEPLAKAKLQLELAEERLAECDALPDKGKEQWCPALMKRYEGSLNSAFELLNTTRGLTSNLTSLVENETSKHIRTLTQLLGRVPEQARPALQRAINVSQIGQPAPLRQILIGEISRAIDSPEVKDRISGIVENATKTGNITEQAREAIKSSLQDELRASAKDIEGIVIGRVESYITGGGGADIRDLLAAIGRGLTNSTR